MRSAISKTFGMLWLMRMMPRPLSRIFPHEPQNLIGLANTERRGGLVEDHHLASERTRPRHRHRLPLPPGQGLDGLVDVLQGADPEALDVVARVLFHRLRVEHPKDTPEETFAPNLTCQVQVAGDIERGRDREGLIDGFDSCLAGVLGLPEVDGLA